MGENGQSLSYCPARSEEGQTSQNAGPAQGPLCQMSSCNSTQPPSPQEGKLTEDTETAGRTLGTSIHWEGPALPGCSPWGSRGNLSTEDKRRAVGTKSRFRVQR